MISGIGGLRQINTKKLKVSCTNIDRILECRQTLNSDNGHHELPSVSVECEVFVIDRYSLRKHTIHSQNTYIIYVMKMIDFLKVNKKIKWNIVNISLCRNKWMPARDLTMRHKCRLLQHASWELHVYLYIGVLRRWTYMHRSVNVNDSDLAIWCWCVFFLLIH